MRNSKMSEFEYDFSWCDFLTPCPHNKGCMVGDYDCLNCEFFVKNNIIKSVTLDPYYKGYFNIGSGIVTCKKQIDNE